MDAKLFSEITSLVAQAFSAAMQTYRDHDDGGMFSESLLPYIEDACRSLVQIEESSSAGMDADLSDKFIAGDDTNITFTPVTSGPYKGKVKIDVYYK